MMINVILAISLVLFIIAMLILLIMSPTKTLGGYKKFVKKYQRDKEFRDCIDGNRKKGVNSEKLKCPKFEDHIRVNNVGRVWLNPKDVVESDGFQKQLRECKKLNKKYPDGFSCDEFGGQIRGLDMSIKELNFCDDCGGFMEYDDRSLLMSSPPKVRGRCTNEECSVTYLIELPEYEKLKKFNNNANG